MKPIRLLLLAAGAAYLYKRFLADRNAGVVETQTAEPFSSEQLGADGTSPPQPEPDAEPSAPQPSEDTLENPTWLDPADAG